MKKILFARLHLGVALGIIMATTIVASSLIAYQSVNAIGIRVGGRITKAEPCVLEPIEERCPNCQLCSNLLAGACGGYTEILFTPAGGTPGQNYICVPNGYLYRGGGSIPRAGGWLKALMLAPQIPVQVGIGR
ncbi:MAG: hypothetical protein Q7S23_02340 [bacterium]|nr:hypothetical protein [bacterium]